MLKALTRGYNVKRVVAIGQVFTFSYNVHTKPSIKVYADVGALLKKVSYCAVNVQAAHF
jgi:hypothetical protein